MEHLITLIKLAELEGLTSMKEAMQRAAEICAADTKEMDLLRRQVRKAGVGGNDTVAGVKEQLLRRKDLQVDLCSLS